MEAQDRQYRTEIGVSRAYAQTHTWVVHALAGWLSAYYMEDPRFRVLQRFHDVETGHEVWICEHEGDFPAKRLIARLRADFPPYQVLTNESASGGPVRYVLDLP